MPQTEEKVMCPVCDEYKIPRALVALSDDRQWLVMLRSTRWIPYQEHWDGDYRQYTDGGWFREDTGQDAQDVLAAWLEGRG